MKNKAKYIIAEINEFISTERSLIIFILLLLFDVMYILFINTKDIYGYPVLYIDALLNTLKNSFYVIMLISIFFFSIYTTYSHFEENLFMICRFKNRKEYLNRLIKKVLRNTTIIFWLNLLLLLVLAIFKWDGTFGVHEYFDYGITNLLYFPFHIIKMYIIFELIACLSVLFIKLVSIEISYILNLLVLLIYYIPHDIIIFIEENIRFPLLYNYYLNDFIFTTFYTELFCSVIYILLFFVIVLLVRLVTLKFMKNN